ncbi:hypothetical protein GCM10009678_70740 [Actinomadura kijaniata]|uniref:FUSC family protein n=1 Tax=Actinomadura namibiensis TaxID=182080 RepID=A0A7W3LLV0_ACTNM|nr:MULTISPECIES: hypothetical protein [Actinomadura]MBA8950525.1 hypothetical protein [Actinomadura namibiensis]
MPEQVAGGESARVGRRAQAQARARDERHGREDAMAVTALVIGLTALVLGFVPATHFFGAVAGVVGLPLALYSQMMSATTNERWMNVIGMVASFVGAAFALRHGGFTI